MAPHCLIETRKIVFKIFLKDMVMKSLMVYVKICARGNVPIYYKTTDIDDMQYLAVATVVVIVVLTVI